MFFARRCMFRTPRSVHVGAVRSRFHRRFLLRLGERPGCLARLPQSSSGGFTRLLETGGLLLIL